MFLIKDITNSAWKGYVCISPVGEGGHSSVHRNTDITDGGPRLCELQWDEAGSFSHHHLDDWAQELWCQKGAITIEHSWRPQSFYAAVKWMSFVPSYNRGTTEVEICMWRLLNVFQAAQSVLISLFQLNTPEFSMLLAALPKTFQDGATKLLQNHLKNTSSVAQARYAHTLNVCLRHVWKTLWFEFHKSVHRHPWAVL